MKATNVNFRKLYEVIAIVWNKNLTKGETISQIVEARDCAEAAKLVETSYLVEARQVRYIGNLIASWRKQS